MVRMGVKGLRSSCASTARNSVCRSQRLLGGGLQFLSAKGGQHQLLVRLSQLRLPALLLGQGQIVVSQGLPQPFERREGGRSARS